MIKYLRKRATLAGPLGGSRGWTLVWAVLLGARVVKRLTTPKTEILLTQEIKPGEASCGWDASLVRYPSLRTHFARRSIGVQRFGLDPVQITSYLSVQSIP